MNVLPIADCRLLIGRYRGVRLNTRKSIGGTANKLNENTHLDFGTNLKSAILNLKSVYVSA